MNPETPLRKVRGLGSSRSGAVYFVRQRLTAIVLVPLTVWFAVTALGLTGVGDVSALLFLSNPMNAVLMGIFVLTMLYHLVLGLREVVIDYVTHGVVKLVLIILVYGFAIVAGLFGIFALASIAIA
jgi:succinate dehydrogenase / fumarate reductase, membrane anchor subunit